MKAGARGMTLFFSLSMHFLLLGGFVFIAREAPNNAERVYRVALAEFAPVPALTPPPPAAVEPPAPQESLAQTGSDSSNTPAIAGIAALLAAAGTALTLFRRRSAAE